MSQTASATTQQAPKDCANSCAQTDRCHRPAPPVISPRPMLGSLRHLAPHSARSPRGQRTKGCRTGSGQSCRYGDYPRKTGFQEARGRRPDDAREQTRQQNSGRKKISSVRQPNRGQKVSVRIAMIIGLLPMRVCHGVAHIFIRLDPNPTTFCTLTNGPDKPEGNVQIMAKKNFLCPELAQMRDYHLTNRRHEFLRLRERVFDGEFFDLSNAA